MSDDIKNRLRDYWAMSDGIRPNGVLIDLWYENGPKEDFENLDRLDAVLQDLARLKKEDVLRDPELIALIWEIPYWLQTQIGRHGPGKTPGWVNRMAECCACAAQDVGRILGGVVTLPDPKTRHKMDL